MTEENISEAEATTNKKAAKAIEEVSDLSFLDTADEAVMTVTEVNGVAVEWKWTFAGPGHPKTVELANRLTRERIREEAAKDQARTNGKKWKEPIDTPEERTEKNIGFVATRLLGWSTIKMGDKELSYPFTPENVKTVLKDPRKGDLLIQALDFIGDNKSFMKRSANS